jgi:multiple sugar transport system substrate-binding protein
MVGSGTNQCEYLISYDSAANMFINSVRQWDGGYTNTNGDILIDDVNTRAMLTQVQSYFQDNTMALPLVWNQQYASTNFLAQDVCLTVGSTAGINYNIPQNNEFEIAVGVVPQYDMDHASAVQQGPNVAIMSDTTDAERLVAWLFIKFLTTEDRTAEWAMLTGYLPVTYSGYNSDVYQDFLNNPDPDLIYSSMAANAAALQRDYFEFDPAFAGAVTSSDARNYADSLMEQLLSGYSVDAVIEDMLYQLGVD